MTDSVFSDSPFSEGKDNKFVVGANNFEQAQQIKRAANDRSEMKYVSLRTTKPDYDGVKVSYRDYSELGGPWTN